MNWNLNCRKTRRLLALAAGNDLEEGDLAGTQRHLAVCPQCREVWEGLRRTQKALEQVGSAPAAEQGLPDAGRPSPSLWPTVARHVRAIDLQATKANWRGWLPAGALAAACLAIVMVAVPDLPSGLNTARYRDPRVIVPRQFVIYPETLSKQPVTIDSDRDADRDAGPQPLKARDEPRSF